MQPDRNTALSIRNTDRIATDFSFEAVEARRKFYSIFQMLKRLSRVNPISGKTNL